MKKKVFSIIGCGNMTQGLFGGVQGKRLPYTFYLYNPTPEKAKLLAEKLGGTVCATVGDLPVSDFYFLGFKPQHFADFSSRLSERWPAHACVISILAGTNIQTISQGVGNIEKIIRLMPNLPCLVGKGVCGLVGSAQVTQDERHEVAALLAGAGSIFFLKKEEEIDLITGASGSGPAYYYEIARVMRDFLQQQGMELAVAEAIARATLVGAAELLQQGPESSLENMRDRVISKKGVTAKALDVLQGSNWQGLFAQALLAAFHRAQEIAQEGQGKKSGTQLPFSP